MGKRGPKPTPTATLKARGSWLAPARAKEGEPQVDSIESFSLPAAPKYLNRAAKAIWRDLGAKLAKHRVLTEWDLNALGRYCHLHAKFCDLASDEETEAKTLTNLQASLAKLDACFGLTPADRASLRVEKPKPPSQQDETAKLLQIAK